MEQWINIMRNIVCKSDLTHKDFCLCCFISPIVRNLHMKYYNVYTNMTDSD